MSVARKTLKLYIQHVKRHKGQFILSCLFTAFAIIAGQVMTPYIASLTLDKLNVSRHSLTLGPFVPLLSVYAAMLVAELIGFRLSVYYIWKFEVTVQQEIIERCFAHLLNQSNRFHTNRFGGALVSQVNKFVSGFERLSDNFVFDMLTFTVYFISILIVLYFRAPLYAATLVVGSIIYFAILFWRSRIVQPYNTAEAQSESARTAQLADSITNIAAVKAFARERLEQKLFRKRTDDTATKSLSVMRVHIRNDVYFNLLTSTVGWLALAIAVVAIVRFNAPLGTVLLIVNYTSNTLRRLWDMARVTRNVNRAFGDAHDMTEILEIEPEIQDSNNPKHLSAVRGDIVFRNVLFAYPEQPKDPLFSNFNLHIKPGEKVGLVGHSGSGKTTLTKLLLRFSDIGGGEILVDGQNIAGVTQTDLRDSIAYVPQEPMMFHRSITDNIAYGHLDAGERQIMAAAKMANAHDFIKNLPKGYDTLVGERGTKLSGGQRQRVAIARAMVKNAPILLLDEATSALDSESEQLIQEALWKLMEGRTAIVIAHRLSTIQRMDRIVVLEDGAIVEQGSHKELIRQNGAYADLWRRQSGGFLEED